jgi:YVTN family beta-propeller protein
VANGVSETVSVIDTASQKVVATIAVGKGPWGIAVSR